MSNELAKSKSNEIDGFDGYTTECEGAKGIIGSSVIVGGLLRFGTDAPYWTCNDEAFPPEREVVAVNVLRVVTKWVNGEKVEEIVLAPKRHPNRQAGRHSYADQLRRTAAAGPQDHALGHVRHRDEGTAR